MPSEIGSEVPSGFNRSSERRSSALGEIGNSWLSSWPRITRPRMTVATNLEQQSIFSNIKINVIYRKNGKTKGIQGIETWLDLKTIR